MRTRKQRLQRQSGKQAMARKKPRDPKRSKAITNCIHHIVDDYAFCMNMTNADGTFTHTQEECDKYWMEKFKQCMARQGFPM
jgi:hypothetical protein